MLRRWSSCLSVERLHVLTDLNGSFLMHHFEKHVNLGIAEAVLFGILPPLLLSGALEDPKL